jgi:hypothetical protein
VGSAQLKNKVSTLVPFLVTIAAMILRSVHNVSGSRLGLATKFLA